MPRKVKQTKPTTRSDEARTVKLVCLMAVIGWMWAAALIANRLHPLENYKVVPPLSPGAILRAGPLRLGFIAFTGLLLGWGLLRLVRQNNAGKRLKTREDEDGTSDKSRPKIPTAALWLLGTYAICALDLVRVMLHQKDAPPALPYSIWEALLHCLLTGLAAASFARHWQPSNNWLTHRRALVGCWVVAIIATIGWVMESSGYHEDFLLGYHDFGHFLNRIVNTWEGRGWLVETPGLPRFWDHFNPALTLLAPLWGAFRTPYAFFALQAVCLAVGIPLVYGIARQFGGSPLASSLWAAGYLFYPATSQLNVSYTYGWHPITQALPLFLLAAYSLSRGWMWACIGCVVLACGFHEGVFVVLAVTCISLAWMCHRRDENHPNPLVAQARCWHFLAAAIALAVGFVFVFRFSGLAEFQTQRFGHLGNSTAEIIASPFTKPDVFWGTVFRPRCLVFVALLVVSFSPLSLYRGWPFLAALALPIGVLVAWEHRPATSIALQYPTTLLPVLFLASLSGSLRIAKVAREPDAAASEETQLPGLWIGGVSCAVGGLAISLSFGSFPWSVPTLTSAVHKTYWTGNEIGTDLRARKSESNREIRKWLAKIHASDARVLATGRIAAHLLGVERLEPVDEAKNRWEGFAEEAGPDKQPIEIFNWVVLDHWEQFQQGVSETRKVSAMAFAAGFQRVYAKHGFEIWRRQP